jgi:hypothetical protein
MTNGEVLVARNLPARRDEVEEERPGYLFSRQHYERAFRIEVEMLVGFAREMLYVPAEGDGVDLYDSPVVRQRRQEAAKAALDTLWAIMAEKNAQESESTPLPGLIAFDEKAVHSRTQRRLRRSTM